MANIDKILEQIEENFKFNIEEKRKDLAISFFEKCNDDKFDTGSELKKLQIDQSAIEMTLAMFEDCIQFKEV